MLENLQKIHIENPAYLIISQIKDLISSSVLKPVEKLLLRAEIWQNTSG